LTTYDKVRKGTSDGLPVQLDVVSSTDVDRMADQVIVDKVDVSATQTAELPRPLIFSLSDRDLWGGSGALTTVFDFSGEVMRRSPEDPLRVRALSADGYLFFLDPDEGSDAQAEALADFQRDARAVADSLRESGVNVRIASFDAPVALCLTKIDLLTVRPHYCHQDGDAVDRFYEELQHIEGGAYRPLLAIQKRSEATRRLLPSIWPDWNIEGRVKRLFRGRYKFFPMTSVSLRENELGVRDLKDRTISPYRILEPLMWLIHMNGYRVLR
jgi:hypothetical protein